MNLRRLFRKSNRNTSEKYARPQDYKFWESLDEFPIWHWQKMHETKDYRYMLKLKDYSRKILFPASEQKFLTAIYEGFLMEFKELDLELEQARLDYQIQLCDYIAQIVQTGNVFKDAEQMDAGWKILLKLFENEDPQLEWIYLLPIKDQQLRRGMTDIARALMEYRKLKARPKSEQTLLDKIVRINSVLSVNIDEKTCSVNKFISYQKAYIEKINVVNAMVQ